MSTFSSISLTLGVSAIFLGVALTGFATAVQCGVNGLLAPRTYARPKQVIKNVLKRPFSVRWISWALNLTYLEMMQGIEGTGTRREGWSGPKLRSNLDGIILLKYHSLCLKVSIFATALCLLIVLPINMTAPCDPDISGEEQCTNITTYYTDFENTTLAHIPIIDTSQTEGLKFVGKSWRTAPGLTLRLWVIVFVAYAIYYYTCRLIWEQWIENLALRRVYYLEFNHYQARQQELEALENNPDPEDPRVTNRQAFLPHPELRDTVPNVSVYSVLYKLPSVHFENVSSASSSEVERQLKEAIDFFDKAVPNQPGYSSSVAAVTILPDVNQMSRAWKRWFDCANKLRRLRFIRKRLEQLHEQKQNGVEVVFSDEQASDSDVGSFHNPHQPLFSVEQSSRTSEGSGSTGDGKGGKNGSRNPPVRSQTPLGALPNKLETVDEGSTGDLSSGDVPGTVPSDVHFSSTKKSRSSDSNGNQDDASLGSDNFNFSDHIPNIVSNVDTVVQSNRSARRMATTERDLSKDRFLASVGVAEESKLDSFLNDEDIEQMTVYAREFARSSASCCPYGCDEYAISHADEATLEDLEQEALEAVEEANEELRRARAEVQRRTSSRDPNVFTVDSPEKRQSTHLENDGFEDMEKDSGSESASITDVSDSSCNLANRWKQAEQLVESERNAIHQGNRNKRYMLDEGNWPNPLKSMEYCPMYPREERKKRSLEKPAIIDIDSYAVVTFTSRQAAIAARQCLADGCGLDRWIEIEKIPIAPLADAPPWNLLDCRGCCRPVTVTLPQEQKRWRGNFVVVIVVVFCLSYTIPLTYFSALVTPARLEEAFPDIPQIGRLSGLLSGAMRVLFFALCPQIFKMLSNFGSGAASIPEAEHRAIKYYWFFMLVTAFTGTSLATVLYEGVIASLDVGGTVKGVLRNVANTVPTTVSAQWMSWIIFRTGITLPYNYLLQFNNFLFSAMGFNCCARATAGGGPGGIAPFRIYVDCGVVFLCVVGLAPACPLIAPFAMICYLLLIPMLRWLVIFTYRPQYDAGGYRWPLLHNILISSMIWAQVVLAAMMGVKRAFGAAILAGIAIIPTYTFHAVCKDRFWQSYKDAGLLQTSELDGWNPQEETSRSEREGFRKWLVDCHKAAYIPVCVNGEDNQLTAEPACVMPTERDKEDESLDSFRDSVRQNIDSPDRCDSTASPVPGGRARASTMDSFRSASSANQRGALFRRVTGNPFFVPHLPERESFLSGVEEGRGRTGSAVSFPHLDTVFGYDEHELESSRENTREKSI